MSQEPAPLMRRDAVLLPIAGMPDSSDFRRSIGRVGILWPVALRRGARVVRSVAARRLRRGASFSELDDARGQEGFRRHAQRGARVVHALLPRVSRRRRATGRGPPRFGLRPPPRDFTQGKFKFAAVESGSLPNDDDFRRIVKKGLARHGDACLGSARAGARQHHSVHQDLLAQVAEGEAGQAHRRRRPIRGWARSRRAIQRGKELYHVTTQCSGCHPNYATQGRYRGDDAASSRSSSSPSFRDGHVRLGFERERIPHHARPNDEPAATEARKHEATKSEKHAGETSTHGEQGPRRRAGSPSTTT